MEGQKKFMYVKQELLQSIKQNPSKLLINPHFVKVSLVKPHFNKNFLANQTIHINPNVIKNHEQLKSKDELVTSNNVQEKTPPRNKVIVSTPTKLVRSRKSQDDSNRIRRISIHSTYKIIRAPSTKTKISPVRHKNRFAVDHRSSTKKAPPIKSTSVFKKCNVKANKHKYVRVNNATNKKSEERKKVMKNNSKSSRGSFKLKILTIHGQKYKLDSSHRTLSLIQSKSNNENQKPMFKTIYIGGMAFKQKEPNVFVKTKVRHQYSLQRQVKPKSINTNTNKLKKSNVPCPLYHKFGKCKGKDSGKCIRLHNPEQISLCPKFIQGACTNSNCLLSHKISAEKMPTCKFFLDGLCSKDDCPYLHVKISSKAEICKDFLEGFCKKAAECDKRHQYLCSDFEKTGKCVKKNCQYPHGNVVRAPKFTKLIIDKLQGQNTHSKPKKEKPIVKKEEITPELDDKTSSVRYYDERQSTNAKTALVNRDPTDNLNSSPGIRKRPQLGSLPSFIPFA